MIRVGSLFSGIGGMDLGLERTGAMRVVWQVEKDPWCRRVLAKHWPDVPRYEDVTTLTGEELAPVDLMCGGFPCQPVSSAGKQKGTDDDRWLWPHFARLLGILRPRYALVENVPGLFTANGGHAFGEVIGDLADLGYDAEWSVLSAADVGAPHLRKRVWIVAHADSEGLQGMRGKRSDAGRENTSGYAGSGSVAVADAGCQSERPTGRGSGGQCDDNATTGIGAAAPDGSPDRRASLADGDSEGDARRIFDGPIRGQWEPEPDVGRVAHGVPQRVDRLRGLGNAVVPQVVEWIGQRLVTAFPEETHDH